MNRRALGIATLATLTAGTAAALDENLHQGPEEMIISVEALNTHFTQAVAHHDDATARARAQLRYWDIGLQLEGYLALDDNRSKEPEPVSFLECTEVTARLDYLFEIVDILQVLPFAEISVYPDISGKAPYNWIGLETWYLLPWEGIEIGASGQYNINDDYHDETIQDNHWLLQFGGRQFWQAAPVDLQFWQTVSVASRSYHRLTSGANTQGLTTIELGAKATLPLPWERAWGFVRMEAHFWIDSDDRDMLKEANREVSELILGIGAEFRG